MSCILVTGGAGYIGSHTVRHLQELGREIVVLDDLRYGHRAALQGKVQFFEGRVGDEALLEEIFSQCDISGVLHFAAYAYVGESVCEPLKYYQNNLAEPLALLRKMKEHQCHQFVFSSTCATYGEPQEQPISEACPQNPINPYGRSKWMLEQVAADCEKAWGLKSVFLRYFNACGADSSGAIGEDHNPETHLIPLVLDVAAGSREHITVFGRDYPTPDGTCVRDYIHVEDLASAHSAALRYLEKGGKTTACNLGTGEGVSVQEIIQRASEVVGKPIATQMGERRPGDPPVLVCNPQKAREVLGWEAQYRDVTDSIRHAWAWRSGPQAGRFPPASQK